MIKKTLWQTAIVFLLATSSFAAADSNSVDSQRLFSSTLTHLNGQKIALESYRGRALIVNFWARWCGPCRQEIPELIAYQKKMAGRVDVLGIGLEDDLEKVKDFVKAYEMDYPVFLAKKEGLALMQTLGNPHAAVPYTLLINRAGKVVFSKKGPVTADDLAAQEDEWLR